MQEYKTLSSKCVCQANKIHVITYGNILVYCFSIFLFPFWKVNLSSSQQTKVNHEPRSDSGLSHYPRHLADTNSFVVSG